MHRLASYFLAIVTLTQSSGFEEEVNCLSNLRLSELLRLKHSVDLLSCSTEDRPPEAINATTTPATIGHPGADSPSALPLTNARSYPEPWHEKPSKLHTLFQVSVTALAFLSFGGYLLCLIVQAIKSKGTTYFHPVATATTTSTNGQLKKIKIFRRSRRMANRSEEVKYADDDYGLAGPSPEELYSTLLFFAEGYVGSVRG